MPSPKKRARLSGDKSGNDNPEEESPDSPDSSPSENEDDFLDEDEDDDMEEAVGGQEIQVEFEARTPEDCDFSGVRHLLQKLFNLSSSRGVDVAELTQFVLSQRNVGSIITQSKAIDDDDDSDDEEFEDLNNEVFGVTSILKLTGGAKPDETPVAKQVREYLVDIAKKDAANLEKLTTLLTDKSNCIGFLISERIMNIPPQISRPLYETLFNEISKAKSKRLPFDFTHFVLVVRCLTPTSGGTQIYVNAEEEMLEEESDFVIEVDCGKKPTESPEKQVAGLNESEYENTSKILVLDAAKCERYLTLLNNLFPV